MVSPMIQLTAKQKRGRSRPAKYPKKAIKAGSAFTGYGAIFFEYMFKKNITAETLIYVQIELLRFSIYSRKPLKQLSMFIIIIDIILHVSKNH